MSDVLDLMRQRLRLGPSRSSQRDIHKPAVTAPEAGDAVEALDHKTRRALGVVTVLAGGVALTHQPLASVLATSHRAGVLTAAHAVLIWPTPLAQPVLAGVGTFVLSIIGVQSRGWRHVTRRQYWYLLASTAAAVLGAGPMALVCVLTIVVIALAIMIGTMVFFGLLVLLILVRRR